MKEEKRRKIGTKMGDRTEGRIEQNRGKEKKYSGGGVAIPAANNARGPPPPLKSLKPFPPRGRFIAKGL